MSHDCRQLGFIGGEPPVTPKPCPVTPQELREIAVYTESRRAVGDSGGAKNVLKLFSLAAWLEQEGRR